MLKQTQINLVNDVALAGKRIETDARIKARNLNEDYAPQASLIRFVVEHYQYTHETLYMIAMYCGQVRIGFLR